MNWNPLEIQLKHQRAGCIVKVHLRNHCDASTETVVSSLIIISVKHGYTGINFTEHHFFQISASLSNIESIHDLASSPESKLRAVYVIVMRNGPEIPAAILSSCLQLAFGISLYEIFLICVMIILSKNIKITKFSVR